jgi:DNA-binding NtrC family response regulator
MKAVLVAEDEHLTRWSVAESLREEHYDVAEAGDGRKAIELITARTFDVVITDYWMPGTINGLDVLRYYQRVAPGRVKVLITSNADANREVKALGGVLLSKPFLLEDLVGIVNSRSQKPAA